MDRAGRRPRQEEILLGENLELLPRFADESFQLIYIDPPFNTGRRQERRTLRAVGDPEAERIGFGGRPYRTELLGRSSYGDSFDDYLAFLAPRLEHAHRLLGAEGTLYFHIDYREAHHCKLLLDEIFGRACFLNEIIWAYDYGGRARRRWPAKHDTILVYVKDPDRYHFDSEEVDREPYMAPGLVRTREGGPRQASDRRLVAHDRAHERAPRRPAIRPRSRRASCAAWLPASSRPGDWCLDFFAGSGTLGAVAASLGRRYVLIDSNPEAVRVMRARLGSPARAGGAAAHGARA